MVNLLKLCVGVRDVEILERHMASLPGHGTVGVVTRMVPTRGDEIAGLGSLYWVIAGKIQARQPITAIVPFVDGAGIRRCRLELAREVVRTVPAPKRAFQGWRYLEPDEAPADLDAEAAGGDPAMLADLAKLGLL